MFSCYRYTQTVHSYHIQAHVDQVHTLEIWTQLNHVLHTYKQSPFFLTKYYTARTTKFLYVQPAVVKA